MPSNTRIANPTPSAKAFRSLLLFCLKVDEVNQRSVSQVGSAPLDRSNLAAHLHLDHGPEESRTWHHDSAAFGSIAMSFGVGGAKEEDVAVFVFAHCI